MTLTIEEIMPVTDRLAELGESLWDTAKRLGLDVRAPEEVPEDETLDNATPTEKALIMSAAHITGTPDAYRALVAGLCVGYLVANEQALDFDLSELAG